MENKGLTVSLSPHTYDERSVKGLMTGVIVALLPAWGVGIWVFGLGAVKVTLVAVASSVFFEYAIQRFLLKSPVRISDGSAVVTGLLLAFNLPSNLPWVFVILGSLVAIGIGKMSFGGLGNNPFNPALVGRVFLLVSFPVAMTSWPQPFASRWQWIDGVTGATPLALVKEGLRNGQAISQISSQLPSYADLFWGRIGGCVGEISACALLVGLAYMLYKRIVTWHIPVSIITTVGLLTGALWMYDPQAYMNPLFHILSGGILLGAFFMATDLVTSPVTAKGMVIFGIGIGALTVLIRVFGVYPEGVSFAILIMNAFVPLINRFCKPRRFGEN